MTYREWLVEKFRRGGFAEENARQRQQRLADNGGKEPARVSLPHYLAQWQGQAPQPMLLPAQEQETDKQSVPQSPSMQPKKAPTVQPQGEQRRCKVCGQLTPDHKRKLGAVAYSEKTVGNQQEHEAIVQSILNRVDSGDRQWVSRGQPINVETVIEKPQQYQGYRGKNYSRFHSGAADRESGGRNARQAVENVQRSVPVTDATSFIVNRGGAAPTSQQVRRLGRVVPANPPKIGDVYLYKPAPVRRTARSR